jgi:4-coumarate--CoA ligase
MQRTTGLPKGVCISHRNLIANVEQIGAGMGLKSSSNERWVGFLPLYHAYGQTFMILMATRLHVPVIVMKAFNLEKFLQVIQDHRITKLQLVPPIMIMLSKRPEVAKYNLSSVKEILCGAAPLSRELQDVVAKKYNIKVCQGWGMTETTCTGTSNPVGGENPVGSIGLVLPNTEIKLIDTAGEEVVAVKTPGEMYIRGPQVALRYWRNEHASKDSFGEGGWFKTGDVAVVNDKGYLWIVDRKKVGAPSCAKGRN